MQLRVNIIFSRLNPIVRIMKQNKAAERWKWRGANLVHKKAGDYFNISGIHSKYIGTPQSVNKIFIT